VKFWAEIATLLIFFIYATFTILIWCANKRVAEDTHRSVVNADRNFRTDERAWMAFKFAEGSLTFTLGKSFLVPTELVNVGKTPAKNVSGKIVVGVYEKGEPLDFTYSPGHASYGIHAGTMFPTGKIVESFEAIKHGQEHAEPIIFTAPLKGNYPLTVGTQDFSVVDSRFGSGDRYHLTPPKDINMRVPDEIRKSVVFIGVKEDLPEWEWKGTGYIIAVPEPNFIFNEVLEHRGKKFEGQASYPFLFLATARHVAEKLEGRDFAFRANKIDGSIAIIEGHADQKWWYHPTEKQYVDAAVTIFFPPNLRGLDINWVGTDIFADEEIIKEAELGVGDEVFMAGLFTKVNETSKNIPIVRIGNLAMMPGEKIPFNDGKLIDAYLVESRSIGGLSGSPVFIRQTILHRGFTASGHYLNSRHKPLPENEVVYVSGLGRIYFLGSAIGHWDAATGFPLTQNEAVNMGISPVVPAHKIMEIIAQPELMEVAKEMSEKMAAKKHSDAVLDWGDDKKKEKTFTKEDFETALKKVSRKKS